MLSTLLCALALGGEHDQTYLTWISAAADVAELPTGTGTRLTGDMLAAALRDAPTPPYRDATAGVRLDDGTLWIASPRGLMFLKPGAARWRLFHSRRWLPDGELLDLAVVSPGEIVVQSTSGMARLRRVESTLDQKMAAINEVIQARHLREGLVGEIRFNDLLDPSQGWVQQTNDNDGLWTSLYVAAESFRYAATGDERAKANARRSLDALMFLETVTGMPGFVARSIVPTADDPSRYGGEWHASSDGKWWWKGDTSSDELDGHYFAYAIYYDLAADDTEREEIRGIVSRITDWIVANGWYYFGPAGKPTTWGVWAPERLNLDPEWADDRGLNSLEILSHLAVAEHVTGDTKYRDLAAMLIDRHGYAANTINQKINWSAESTNHSDDELAFLAYYPLLRYESDSKLRSIYVESLERSFAVERPEGSPLFNYIYAAGLQAASWRPSQGRPAAPAVSPKKYDREKCLDWFREVPSDRRLWAIKNSDRADLPSLLHQNRHRRACSCEVLPIAERRVMKWNGDPYELDGGGDGAIQDDGTFILLPYWMGRYHRFVE